MPPHQVAKFPVNLLLCCPNDQAPACATTALLRIMASLARQSRGLSHAHDLPRGLSWMTQGSPARTTGSLSTTRMRIRAGTLHSCLRDAPGARRRDDRVARSGSQLLRVVSGTTLKRPSSVWRQGFEGVYLGQPASTPRPKQQTLVCQVGDRQDSYFLH